ncbi:hypothetical protein [Pseudomonas putida]
MSSEAERGFTLLEVLLVLSFVGFLLVIIMSVLILSRHAVDITSSRSIRLDQLRAAQDFLRTELEGAIFPSGVEAEFTGDADHLRFVSTLPEYVNAGVREISLGFVNMGGADKGLRATFCTLKEKHREVWGQPIWIFQNANHVRFQYRGLDNRKKMTGWLSSWPWPQRLPNYVKIDVDIADGPMWPTLTVAIPGRFEDFGNK